MAEQPQLDTADRNILAALADDARLSMSKLADAVGVSRATAYNRVARLVEIGAIRQFTAVVDPKILGHRLTALVMVNVDQGDWRSVRDAIRGLPSVKYAGLVTGDRDVVIIVQALGIDELRDVVLGEINGLPSVQSTRTLLVLDEFVDRVNLSKEVILGKKDG